MSETRVAPGTIGIDGEALRRVRMARVMSQRELAKLAEVRPATVNQLELGHRDHVYPATIRKLAAALGVEPRELLKDDRP